MQAMTPRVTASTVSLRAFGFQPNAWPLIEELSGFPNRRRESEHSFSAQNWGATNYNREDKLK